MNCLEVGFFHFSIQNSAFEFHRDLYETYKNMALERFTQLLSFIHFEGDRCYYERKYPNLFLSNIKFSDKRKRIHEPEISKNSSKHPSAKSAEKDKDRRKKSGSVEKGDSPMEVDVESEHTQVGFFRFIIYFIYDLFVC